HTRFSRDWSSDVCSSDLAQAADAADGACEQGEQAMRQMVSSMDGIRAEITHTAEVVHRLADDSARIGAVLEVIHGIAEQTNLLEIGRASCRERAEASGGG